MLHCSVILYKKERRCPTSHVSSVVLTGTISEVIMESDSAVAETTFFFYTVYLLAFVITSFLIRKFFMFPNTAALH